MSVYPKNVSGVLTNDCYRGGTNDHYGEICTISDHLTLNDMSSIKHHNILKTQKVSHVVGFLGKWPFFCLVVVGYQASSVTIHSTAESASHQLGTR